MINHPLCFAPHPDPLPGGEGKEQVVLTSWGRLELVALECILLEVLQRQKLVIAAGAIFTSFSTESVEGIFGSVYRCDEPAVSRRGWLLT